ncbi:MAG: molecular chaperone, partial [Dehalococcoidia bacterium]
MCALISTITLSNEQQAAQALSRSEVYLFLSRAFLYPQEDLQPFYQRARFAVHTLGEQDLFAPPEVPPLPTLKQEYVHTFGHTTPKDYSPYETDYGQSHIFMQSQALMALASFYRAFGLEAARGERLDHIGPELEFMYFLTYKEAYSLAHKRTRRADTCREGQRLFLERHLGRWTP